MRKNNPFLEQFNCETGGSWVNRRAKEIKRIARYKMEKMIDNRKILYIDMDGVLVDFESAFAKLPDWLLDDHLESHRDCIPDIFYNMDPMPGAQEAFAKLCEAFNVYIASTPSWYNDGSWTDKARWVKRYLGDDATKRLILTHNKGILHGDYIIDDRNKHSFIQDFRGEHIHFGIDAFPDWDSVVPYLLERA